MIARMSAAYADMAPEEANTLHISSADFQSTQAHLIRIASLMLKGPGFTLTPHTRFPLLMKRSFAMRWPSGYVARMTKYEEKLGAFDLK